MSSADSPASAFAELTAKGGDTTWYVLNIAATVSLLSSHLVYHFFICFNYA